MSTLRAVVWILPLLLTSLSATEIVGTVTGHDDKPVDGVERILGRETDLLHRLDPLHGRPDVLTMGPGELLHHHRHPRGMGGVLDGFQGPGPGRLDGGLDGLGEEIAGDNTLRHARRHELHSAGSAGKGWLHIR